MPHEVGDLNYMDHFPTDLYPQPSKNQRAALEFLSKHKRGAILELPTGTGKTAVGYAFLQAHAAQGAGPLFYIVPTKTLVEQVARLHPDLTVALGRHEYLCLYPAYEGQMLLADEIPCIMLADCPSRVDQETGETFEKGAQPCPYYAVKFTAKQSQIVVCTMSFYLFTQLFSKEWEQPAAIVIDEAHQIAKVIRGALSFEISDWHLRRSAALLKELGARKEATQIMRFVRKMIRVIRSKPPHRETILETKEIETLLETLDKVDADAVEQAVGEAFRTRRLSPREHRETLKRLEVLIRDLRRYVRALQYALPEGDRNPLNYTCAYYRVEKTERERKQYSLIVKAYYVAPLVKKLLGKHTLAYSATIGDPEIFGYETGIKLPFQSFTTDFPEKNARVYLPTDTPNLATKVRSNKEPTRVLRKIAKACVRFGEQEKRSLVVVVSEAERRKFIQLAEEEQLDIVSYGEGLAPKDAAAAFRDGQGNTLVGTVANFGEGVDLPKGIAPVIFFLRPSYPPPHDPLTIFEGRRFGSARWQLWNWRVMIEALQVRGRNIRSAKDLGVTFFISQHFRRFLFASLPEELQKAYRGELAFEKCIEDALTLLG